ncbi:phytanoyl-CoA dioxygenase family protein [Nocardia aurea]|uniref:phytanoyl-CoA dioxygenase family protein n=1 Tax=Nocardia aurea TaxID=2144174 RepID=UPI00339ECD7C
MPDNAQLEAVFQETGIDTITCSAGEIVMFDSNCLHASTENLSPQGRRNLFIVFNARTNRLQDVPYAAGRPRPNHLARR